MRFLTITVVLVTATCVFTVTAIGAQTSDSLRIGQRVRVGLQGQTPSQVVGTFLGWHSDSLLVSGPGGMAMPLARTAITSMELSIGERSKAGKGAVIGLLSGAAAGAVLGLVIDPASDCGGNADVGQCPFFLWGAAILGGLGTLIGAGAGNLQRTEVWRELPLDVFTPTPPDTVSLGSDVQWVRNAPNRRFRTATRPPPY